MMLEDIFENEQLKIDVFIYKFISKKLKTTIKDQSLAFVIKRDHY